MKLEGSSALVAGGASGLGEATSRRLHAEGASIVIADLNKLKDFTADGMVPKASFPDFHEKGTDCLGTSEMKGGEWVAAKDGDYPFVCSKSGSISLAG